MQQIVLAKVCIELRLIRQSCVTDDTKKHLREVSLTDPIASIGFSKQDLPISGCTITTSHLFHVFIFLPSSWIVVDPREAAHNKSYRGNCIT